MLDNAPVKVGDELVEYGRVYKVFKIADKPGMDGKMEKHIFFKPVYATSDNKTLICAIPVRSLDQANIRRPLTKKDMTELLSSIPKLSLTGEDALMDINVARDILKRNNPLVNAQMLNNIWQEVNEHELEVTKSKKDILALSLNSLTQEVALAYGLTLEKAEKKLQNALKR